MKSIINRFELFLSSKLDARLWPVIIICVSSITLFLVISTVNQILEQSKKDTEKELEAILRTAQGGIRLWKRTLAADLETLTQLPSFKSLIDQSIIDQYNLNEKKRKVVFDNFFAPWMKNQKYLGFKISTKDTDGNPQSSFASEFFSNNSVPKNTELITEALNGDFQLGEPKLVSTKSGRTLVILASVPVRNEKNVPFAVLTTAIAAHEIFSAYTMLGHIGQTGEVYALNRSGDMVTNSRFLSPQDDFIKLKQPNGEFTLMAQNIRRGQNGSNLTGYHDYRGIEVIGSWLWDDDLDLGLATEIDKSEAYKSYKMIQKLLWIIILIIMSGMILLLLLRETRARNLWRIESLKQAENGRKELLAVVSHDLKNPLSVLLMTNELLIKTLPSNYEFTEKRKKLLQKSQIAAQQMRRLITDLLDSTRIEAGRLEIHPVKCSGIEIIKNTFEILGSIATEKGVKLSASLSENLPMVYADTERILQVFSNLIGNAIKFTEANGEVEISGFSSNGFVQFSIRDTGPGISEQDIPHLFERYWQAKKAKSFGTGLGLTICKELITAHGGKIWIDSIQGEGTTFHFTLPIFAS